MIVQSFGKIFALLALALAVHLSPIEAFETDLRSPIEKIEGDKAYLKPGSIYISENQIYLCYQQEMVGLSTISADEQGVYASVSEIIAKTHPRNDWICTYCGADNSDSNKFCRICGKQRADGGQ